MSYCVFSTCLIPTPTSLQARLPRSQSLSKLLLLNSLRHYFRGLKSGRRSPWEAWALSISPGSPNSTAASR